MGAFQRRYSDDQRRAIQQAWHERAIRSGARIASLAACGELTVDGDLIDAFEIVPASAAAIGRRYEQAMRRGAKRAAALEPADAVEEYRRRLAGIIDGQLSELERLQARKRHRDVKSVELTGLGRALRELASVPSAGAQSDPAKKVTREKRDGRDAHGQPRGGLADKLRASMAPRGYEPAQDDQQSDDNGDDGHAGAASDAEAERAHEQASDDPGTYVRERIGALTGELMSVRPA